MKGPRYYGEYKSVMTQTNGCVSALISIPRETVDFPPMISRHCQPCADKKAKHPVHGFRLANTILINTEGQRRTLEERCKSSDTPFEVEIV